VHERRTEVYVSKRSTAEKEANVPKGARKETPSAASPRSKSAPPPSATHRRPVVDEISLPRLDDLDDLDLPPIHGKTNPPAEMDDTIPALDDSDRVYHHHPVESGVTEFGSDPDAADAASDLASDLGRDYLEGATRADDMSDIHFITEDREESELPFVIEEEEEEFEDVDVIPESSIDILPKANAPRRAAGRKR